MSLSSRPSEAMDVDEMLGSMELFEEEIEAVWELAEGWKTFSEGPYNAGWFPHA